jgi:dipeptidyl aminopeptidase/acylaminoacyl peptidase
MKKLPLGPRFRSLAVLSTAVAVMLSTAALQGCGGGPAGKLRDPSGTTTPEVSEAEKVSIDDLLYAESVIEQRISPDGSSVAWIKSGYVAGSEAPVNNIFITSLDDLSTQQLTDYEGEPVSSLMWSPDGSLLSYMTDAPAPGVSAQPSIQVWSWRPGQAAPSPLTSVEDGVQGYAWKDQSTLLYLREDGAGRGGEDSPGDTIHVTEYATAPVRLYRQDVSSGKAERITGNDDRITGVHVSPDGNYAFVTRTRAAADRLNDQYFGNIPVTNHLLDLKTGIDKRVFKNVKQALGAGWSQDSGTLYVNEAYCPDNPAHAYVVRLGELDVSTGAEGRVDLSWERGLMEGASLKSVPEGFFTFVADGCNPKLVKYTRSGDACARVLMKGAHQGHMYAIDVSADGKTICYQSSSQSTPPQCFVASLDGGTIVEPRQYTKFNPQFEGKVLAKSESVTWTGALGDTVEGMLFYPAGYKPGNSYPLVLAIHGGPFASTLDLWDTAFARWAYPYQLFCNKGAFVLDANYHGSSDYGFAFADSIKDGKFYEYPLDDLRNGISRLADLGLVDAGRLGTLGWSNGSMLSNALIATDSRFRAASCGSGGGEWVTLWGQCEFGDGTLSYYFGGDPVAKPGTYKDPELAPFYNAEKVKTPTLMFLGGDDTSVPPAQTWVTYRGIQKYADVPVELFVFPGEPHVLQKLSHQKRKMVEEQKWFDRYLFEKGE